MLSSDKNVETIAQLIEAMKHYLGLQTEYVKLDVIEKVVRLLKLDRAALSATARTPADERINPLTPSST